MAIQKSKKNNEWNLSLLYSSINDERFQKDIVDYEETSAEFSRKYNNANNSFVENDSTLLQSLKDYEAFLIKTPAKPLMYLYYILDLNVNDNKSRATFNLVMDRILKADNKTIFYRIALGQMSKQRKDLVMNNSDFSKYHYFLSQIFKSAKYHLTDKEEKIINLKSTPANSMWVDSHLKALSSITIKWKGKNLPLAQANNIIQSLNNKQRRELSKLISIELKKISFFTEAEMNAVLTDKKIEDSLRGFTKAYESTILNYENDSKTVENLVKVVTDNFSISNKFFKLKAKLLGLKSLSYCDRGASYGKIKGNFTFDYSKKMFSEVLERFDKKYLDMFNKYLENGQIDIYPRKGKVGGAYCSSAYAMPTFVLLNHSNEFRSYTTLAHEMGHAFHSELSKTQVPVYSSYSMSLAETASTFFESLAFEKIVEILDKKQKIIALHNKINDEISTIFRQIACFNFENDLHNKIRETGYLSKEEMGELHNKNMKAYLGPVFKMDIDDGYFYVQWSHIRRYFYVYSYAYGLLVSKAMLKRYREDEKFKDKIEKFLSAGDSDTPENILRDIGIDIDNGKVFKDGLDEIKKDIDNLEKMMK